MDIWAIRDKLQTARTQINVIRSAAPDVGALAVEDEILRNMRTYQLRKLKMKLKEYNAHTGKWRGED